MNLREIWKVLSEDPVETLKDFIGACSLFVMGYMFLFIGYVLG